MTDALDVAEVAHLLARNGEYAFAPRHYTDVDGIRSDRLLARSAGGRLGWEVATVTTQRDGKGEVVVRAFVLDGSDGLAERLFKQIRSRYDDDAAAD